MHSQHRAKLRIVQPDQHLVARHAVAFGHEQGRDNAAFLVLHRLAAALYRQCAGAYHGAIQRGDSRPGAKAAKGYRHHSQAQIYGV